ncbi:hypothetical protein [Siminovitchia terrae]|uniref:hypothetical protein n=1 Tax=Siminovitchia terrae TaxID=1914933 RepID=UPI001FEA2A95|nr:hypothetical protein [Siminovitchia terrae]
MSGQNNEITHELSKALKHLSKALTISIHSLKADPDAKKHVGELWESFLSAFFSQIRERGKESKINLLHLISFSNIRKY